MDHKEQAGVEDILPVRSRISWGAIFAGAVIALAIYLVLTVLGAAVGLSLTNTTVRGSTLWWSAVIWAPGRLCDDPVCRRREQDGRHLAWCSDVECRLRRHGLAHGCGRQHGLQRPDGNGLSHPGLRL
jgi:hypothetical protein